ncbi:DUF2065 family protein [Pontitalea aquivivens]|uniref:DUF2065 family protein n=1 Tax=Pontitalea aquivivens TaxID=3388663 RepID=UPI003970583A
MIATILWGIGLVLVIEGLALALAPSRMEEMLELLRAMGRDRRRLLGLVVLGGGIAALWLARAIAG